MKHFKSESRCISPKIIIDFLGKMDFLSEKGLLFVFVLLSFLKKNRGIKVNDIIFIWKFWLMKKGSTLLILWLTCRYLYLQMSVSIFQAADPDIFQHCYNQTLKIHLFHTVFLIYYALIFLCSNLRQFDIYNTLSLLSKWIVTTFSFEWPSTLL